MDVERRGTPSAADRGHERSADPPDPPTGVGAVRTPRQAQPGIGRRRGEEPPSSSIWEPLPSEWEEEAATDLGRTTDFGEVPMVVAAPDRAVLLRMDGAEAGRVYSLDRASYSIGRLSDNDIVLDDGDVSRHHARVCCHGGRYFVEDAGSRNGTYVQGRATSRTALEPGDLIQLGPRTGLKFDRIDQRQESLLKQLYDSSTRDALTGAYNRRHFDDRFSAEIAFAQRHNAQVGIVLIDIDHFKRINDSYGHHAGDLVLGQLSARIQRQLRTEDVFARIGGEEFAVVLRGITAQGCSQLAERLRAKIAAEPMDLGGRSLNVTISAGCAARSGRAATALELFRLADERLYAAKRQGRNRVVSSE